MSNDDSEVALLLTWASHTRMPIIVQCRPMCEMLKHNGLRSLCRCALTVFHRTYHLKPNSITLFSSLVGCRPARDQIPLHYPPRYQIASRSATSSPARRRPASEQDSIMEYALNRSANQLASWFASWSATC